MTEGELTDAAFWDGVWRNVSPGRPLSPLHPYFGRRGKFLRMVRRRIGDVADRRILEVGAGGTNHRLLALHKWAGAHVTAVDYSEVGLRVLQEVFRSNGGHVDVVHGDFLHTPIPGEGFDVVVHWGVLEHFEDPVPMLRACRAALKPTGHLLFSMPNLEAWATRWWAEFSPDNWSKHILHSDDALRCACEQAGFEFTESFYFGHPAVQMASWERRGPVPTLLGMAQRVATIVGSLIPIAAGGRRSSQERGILARATP